MRLGAYRADLKPGSHIAEIYGETEISERHRHRYEVNTAYRARLEDKGMIFAGMSPDGAAAGDDRVRRSSLVHRRAVSPGTEVAAVRAASAVRELHRGGEGAEPAGLEAGCVAAASAEGLSQRSANGRELFETCRLRMRSGATTGGLFDPEQGETGQGGRIPARFVEKSLLFPVASKRLLTRDVSRETGRITGTITGADQGDNRRENRGGRPPKSSPRRRRRYADDAWIRGRAPDVLIQNDATGTKRRQGEAPLEQGSWPRFQTPALMSRGRCRPRAR